MASAILLCTLQVGAAQAATFSAAGDFNSITNPNGAWSYGSYATLDDPSSFAALTTPTANVFGLGLSGYTGSGSFAVAKNETGAVLDSGTPTYPVDSLILHPGTSGEQAVVRWTAPTAGTYAVTGGFYAADFDPVGNSTTVDGSVYRNAVEEFTGAVVGFTAPNALFALSLGVVAGDTIDFVVGYGSDLSWLYDSTELRATIESTMSPVPVPAALPLFLAGLLGLGVMARRRKQKVAAA